MSVKINGHKVRLGRVIGAGLGLLGLTFSAGFLTANLTQEETRIVFIKEKPPAFISAAPEPEAQDWGEFGWVRLNPENPVLLSWAEYSADLLVKEAQVVEQDAAKSRGFYSEYAQLSEEFGASKIEARLLSRWSQNPKNPAIHFVFGVGCLYQHEQGESVDLRWGIKHLDKALELNPDFAAAYYYRGQLHQLDGNEKQAKRDLQRAQSYGAALTR